MNHGTIWALLMQKKHHRKSHAWAPLSDFHFLKQNNARSVISAEITWPAVGRVYFFHTQAKKKIYFLKLFSKKRDNYNQLPYRCIHPLELFFLQHLIPSKNNHVNLKLSYYFTNTWNFMFLKIWLSPLGFAKSHMFHMFQLTQNNHKHP